MLLFAVALALLTAIAFGVVPAMLMARGDMQRPLKESGRGGDGGGARRRARSMLVVAEIGLAVMLLVGAALLARSFQRLVQQDPGFKPTRAVTAKVELPYCVRRLPEDRRLLRSAADVAARAAGRRPSPAPATSCRSRRRGAARSSSRAGRARGRATSRRRSIRRSTRTTSARSACRWSRAASSTPHDTADAPGVVIVNDALARRQWPGEDPIGQTIDVADHASSARWGDR